MHANEGPLKQQLSRNLTQERHARAGSQVCNLLWSKAVNELVSTHGYSQNQIVLWRAPSLARLATLKGHSMRVLYLTAAPDGQTIVTGAGVPCMPFPADAPCIAGPLVL